MKEVTYFGGFFFIILTFDPTLGHGDTDRFIPFPPLPRFCPCARELRAIEARCSAIETSLEDFVTEEFGGLKNQIAALTNLSLSLLNAVNNLTNIITHNSTTNGTKCPASAPSGSKVIGSLCYSFNTTAASFQNANTSCHFFGGNLTEPLFDNRATFYNSIQAAFPNETNLIGANGEFWIGLLQPPSATPSTTPFAYLSNSSLTVSPTSSAFSSPPTVLNVTNAVVFVSPGAPKWKFYNIASIVPILKPFICQYKLV